MNQRRLFEKWAPWLLVAFLVSAGSKPVEAQPLPPSYVPGWKRSDGTYKEIILSVRNANCTTTANTNGVACYTDASHSTGIPTAY